MKLTFLRAGQVNQGIKCVLYKVKFRDFTSQSQYMIELLDRKSARYRLDNKINE